MWPSLALYWHIGARPRRLWKVVPRIVRGVKSLGMGLPLVWGTRAVPAVGVWAGVKKGTPFAGWVGMSGQ